MTSWTLKKLSGHCGACIEGISLARASRAQLEKVRSYLFKHGIIVFLEQYFSSEDHIKLAEFFGAIEVNRYFTPAASHPVIAEVRTTPKQTQVIGGTWHPDHSYDLAPAICSILSAQQLPPYGGDTHFASMSAAYYAMSSGLQDILRNLRARHSDGSFVKSNVGINPKQDAFRGPVLHPVIIKHPNTGAPCVYVNGDFYSEF